LIFNTTIITQDIVDKGVVNITLSDDGHAAIAIPASILDYEYFYSYDVGSITLTIVKTSGNFDTAYLRKYIKVTVIAGN